MIAYAIDHHPAPVTSALAVPGHDRSHHGPGLEDVTPRPSLALDDAQEDLLQQIARGRSRLTFAESEIADELGMLDLVVIGRARRYYATRKGCAAVGLRRVVPVPGRHRVTRKVRNG